MPLIIAKQAGFCMGVKKAVHLALETAEACKQNNLQCYSLGELIHNPLVIEQLREQGVQVADAPEDAKDGVLVLRSHGVPPDELIRAQRSARTVVDCTCPFVTRVHKTVEEYSKDGAPIILVGDADHPEVRGTAGWCKGEVFIVSDEASILALPDHARLSLLVCQTTYPPERWEMLKDLLLSRFPELSVSSTICPATHQRQEEAARIAKIADRMIVIGGKKSANTRKLYETCKALCPNTYLVERAAELPSHLMHPDREIIGITAGASTPDWSLKEVVDCMNDIERNDQVTPESPIAETISTTHELPEAQNAAPEAAHAEPEKSFMDQVADSIARIRTGQTIEGVVVQITDDEVCVNIGYKSDGLIKRSELVDKDVQLGDTIEVEVVKVNDGEGNVILSQRNIINRKVWDEIMKKHETGEYVDAVGKEAVKGGLLASINGVRAFVPASQLSQRYVEKINQFVGQPMKLKIIEIDSSKKRVVASRKAVLVEEADKIKDSAWGNLAEGEVVKGVVRRFAPFGAFVDLGGVDGLIHISDLSWSRSATPADILQINQEIEVKIVSLDRERERIQLSLKALQPKPWDDVIEKYPVGSIVTRKVVRIRPFGAFIELESGVDGLCHISQVALTRVGKIEDVLTPGQEVNVKILSVDPEAKRISLSIREAMEDHAFDYSEDIPGLDMIDDHIEMEETTEEEPEA